MSNSVQVKSPEKCSNAQQSREDGEGNQKGPPLKRDLGRLYIFTFILNVILTVNADQQKIAQKGDRRAEGVEVAEAKALSIGGQKAKHLDEQEKEEEDKEVAEEFGGAVDVQRQVDDA